MEEQFLRIPIYQDLPPPKEFVSVVEPRNVPAVFRGCTNHWRAFTHWNPSNGGLDYLHARVGSSIVEAMLSPSAPVFYGDLGSHHRVPIPFSTFISLCKKRLSIQSEHQQLDHPQIHDDLSLEDAPEQIYLAQVPIMNSENQERVQLETLREDIQIPSILLEKEPSCINLWMNNAQARSSTHYDPHHNLLCIVSGRKRVSLWPPSEIPSLYPMPIYGEASNHSSVALENPDYLTFPRAERSMELAQTVILEAGDAVFIPEGWFHQVDSDDLTIAVNFWWRSNIMSCMLEHMDAYYLRRILTRLIDKEMNHLLLEFGMVKNSKLPNKILAERADENYTQAKDLKEKRLKEGSTLLELEPAAVQVLHEIVSLVHTSVSANQDQQLLPSSLNDCEQIGNGKCKKIVTGDLKVDVDPVAKILWDVEPRTLQFVFLALAQNFPRTLEALVLHVLSPLGAEVLTRKFDEMDQQTVEEDRSRFYEVFYGAFDDQSAAMNSILKGKEAFARQAYDNVLDKFLGVNLEGSKPAVR